MLDKVEKSGHIQGISIARHVPRITHQLQVGDLVLFFRPNQQSYDHLLIILRQLSNDFNLHIYLQKFACLFNFHTLEFSKKIWLLALVLKYGKYLGTYVDHPKDNVVVGIEILTRISHKLQGWKVRMLS